MMPASTTAGGQCAANAPDVCKTPSPAGPVPVPYPNLGTVAQALKFSTKVMFAMKNALTKMSEIPMSSGDEAGVAGGVVSGVNMNKVLWMQGSTKVTVEGKPVVYHTAPTGHNGVSANTMGSQVAPSQQKVLVAS
jgi:hypothetical protein